MANKHRGHVDLVAGLQTYRFVFSTNAICELEDETGETISAIGQMLQHENGTSMKFVRQIVWAALRDFHSEISLVDTGKVIDEAGLAATMQAVGEAFQLAFPAPAEPVDSAVGNAPRPSKAKPAGRG